MAWVDVAKAHDSVGREWLDKMMILQRFPTWLKNVTSKLSASWNTRIQCKTDKGAEGYKLSRPIGSKVTDLIHIDDLKILQLHRLSLQQ